MAGRETRETPRHGDGNVGDEQEARTYHMSLQEGTCGDCIFRSHIIIIIILPSSSSICTTTTMAGVMMTWWRSSMRSISILAMDCHCHCHRHRHDLISIILIRVVSQSRIDNHAIKTVFLTCETTEQ